MRYTVYVNGVFEKTRDFLSAYKGKKLAVGLSGGRDSVCLLHAVLLCGVVDKSAVVAVHVNHRLRETATRDEKFVTDICARLGVECLTYSVDVKGECVASGQTVEQAARNLRYGVFEDIIKSGRADYILTAHHALDNAESVLMHMFRGAGLDGLCGMQAANEGKRLLRPFLSVYPDELDEFAAQNKIEYVVDETNLIDDADRNFLRLNVIPLIERRYRGVVRSVNALSDECKAASGVLDGAIDRSKITRSFGAVVIDGSALSGALAGRYVRAALEYFTTIDITREQIERVVTLAHMRTGAVIELSCGIKAAKEYGCVALYLPRGECDACTPVSLGACFIDGLAVEIALTDTEPRSIVGGVVDFDKLSGAVIRFRRDGDVFTPCGGGTKKLKQYFIDRKVPSRLRDRIPLICRGNEVLVVVGMQISDGVKVTAVTKNKAAVKLRW